MQTSPGNVAKQHLIPNPSHTALMNVKVKLDFLTGGFYCIRSACNVAEILALYRNVCPGWHITFCKGSHKESIILA